MSESQSSIPWKTLEDLVVSHNLRELTILLKEVGVERVMEVRNAGGKNLLHFACEKEVLQVRVYVCVCVCMCVCV